MTRLTALLSFLLVCAASAQVVKAFSIQMAPTCEITVIGGTDIEDSRNFGSGRYVAYKDGCTATIYDIQSQAITYRLDLSALGVNTATQLANLTFYRNITSDGGWAAIYSSLSTYNDTAKRYDYTVGIVIGNALSVLSKTATSAPSFYSDSKSLYLAVSEPDRIDFYILRNNLTQKSAAFLGRVGPDHVQSGRIWYEYDPAGRYLNDGNTPRNVKMLRR